MEFLRVTEDLEKKFMDNFELAQKAVFRSLVTNNVLEERVGFRIISYSRSYLGKRWEIQYEGLLDGIEVEEQELYCILLDSDLLWI